MDMTLSFIYMKKCSYALRHFRIIQNVVNEWRKIKEESSKKCKNICWKWELWRNTQKKELLPNLLVKRSDGLCQKWTYVLQLNRKLTCHDLLRGDTHMKSTLMGYGVGGGWQKWDVIRHRVWGVASVLDIQSLFFLSKKIAFAPWPDIMLSQIIYFWEEISLFTLVSDSEVIF